MNRRLAKKIGGRQGLIFSVIGMLVAYSITSLLNLFDHDYAKAFLWLIDYNYWINILIGAVIFIFFCYLSGQKMAIEVLINKKNSILTGIFYCNLCLVLTTFATAQIAFFTDGILHDGLTWYNVYFYLYRPVYWMFLYGFFPAVFMGIGIGKAIDKYNKGLY